MSKKSSAPPEFVLYYSFIDDGKLEFVYATEMLKIGLTKCKELGIKDW